MIEAMIYEGRDNSGYGTYGFSHLPSPGDHIHVGNNRGSVDVLRVIQVEHHPVALPVRRNARPDAHVTIRVEPIESYGD